MNEDKPRPGWPFEEDPPHDAEFSQGMAGCFTWIVLIVGIVGGLAWWWLKRGGE